MTPKGAGLIGLLIGFAGGAAAAYIYIRKKEEVIEFVPNENRKPKNSPGEKNEKTNAKPAKKDVNNYIKIVENNYHPAKTYSQKYNEQVEIVKDQMEATKKDTPWPISSEMFHEGKGRDGYGKFTLKYFRDGILVDDQGNLLDNPDELVGADFASHFGEYDEDVAYIRNDRTMSDFEILYVDYDFMDS